MLSLVSYIVLVAETVSPQHNSLGRYPGFGVTECFSPYDSTRVSLMSKGQEEMFHTQLSSGLPRLCSLLRSSRVSLC